MTEEFMQPLEGMQPSDGLTEEEYRKSKEVHPKLVCPVTGEEPDPEPIDRRGRLDPVMRCWVCGNPLQRRYYDGNGKRLD